MKASKLITLLIAEIGQRIERLRQTGGLVEVGDDGDVNSVPSTFWWLRPTSPRNVWRRIFFWLPKQTFLINSFEAEIPNTLSENWLGNILYPGHHSLKEDYEFPYYQITILCRTCNTVTRGHGQYYCVDNNRQSRINPE